MTDSSELGIDPGLLERFRAAGGQITWSDAAPPGPKGRRRASATPPSHARIARLNDESARVETTEAVDSFRLVAESGPVGALVLLLACADRGLPVRLQPHLAGERTAFPMGAIEAAWGSAESGDRALGISDLVGLARYALP